MPKENKKDIKKYVILTFFLGCVGAHRFYIGKTRSATVMLVASLFACVFGFWTLFHIVLLWALIDGIVGLNNFSNPQNVFQQSKEDKIKNEKYNEYMANLFLQVLEGLPGAVKEGIKSLFSFVIGTLIVVYLVITFGFPFFFDCPKGDTSCRCFVSAVNKNMSFSDKIGFIVNGANRQDLIPYLDFGDAIKCAMIPD